jgi:hypothetical protein
MELAIIEVWVKVCLSIHTGEVLVWYSLQTFITLKPIFDNPSNAKLTQVKPSLIKCITNGQIKSAVEGYGLIFLVPKYKLKFKIMMHV